MSTTRKTEISVLKKLVISDLIICGILLLIMDNPRPYINGIIFGSSISYLNFKLLAFTLNRAVLMPKSRVMPYVMANYMARYIITGIVLTISILGDHLDFISTIIGFILIKLLIHGTNLMSFAKKDVTI